MIRIPSALLLCAGLAGTSTRVAALDANEVLLFSWGKLTVKPQVALTETYSDNIFARGDGNEAADLTTTISPGVTFLLGRRTANHVILNYTLSQHFYMDRTDLNSMEHSFDLTSAIDGARLSLRGLDRIQLLSSPISDTKVLELGAVDRPLIVTDDNVERTTFYDSYTVGYKISPKAAAYVQGLHIGYDYEDGVRLFDQTTFAGTGGFGYLVVPKVTLFGEVFYGVTASAANVPAPDTADMTFVGGAIGARGAFTPKFAGNVRIGYETREFDDGSGASGSPVANVGLNYRASSKTEVVFNYSLRQDVSIQFEQQSYTANIASLQLTQTIGQSGKLRATVGGYYGLYDYDASRFSAARNYDVYSLNFNVAYQIQLWLSASLGFDRTSVVGAATDVTSYDVNRVTFRLAVGY